MKYCQIFFLTIFCASLYGQVKISSTPGSAHPSAILDVESSTKGLLIPRMTATEMFDISSPTNGLIIYNTSANRFYGYYSGSWQSISSQGSGSTSKWSVAVSPLGGTYLYTNDVTNMAFLIGTSVLPDTSTSNSNTEFLYFNKDKGSFRGGRLLFNLDGWDADSLGMYSFAYGEDARAKGNYSIALGQSVEASNFNSVAIGKNSVSNGSSSIAIGNESISSGNKAISIGDHNDASVNSLAIGVNNSSNSNTNIAIGKDNNSEGAAGSFAIGIDNSVTTASFGAAMGRGLAAEGYVAIGNYNDPEDLQPFPRFVVGTGVTDATRKNGLVLYANGDLEMGAFTIKNNIGANGSLMTYNSGGTTSWTSLTTDGRITGNGINSPLTLPDINTDATISGNGYDTPLSAINQPVLSDGTLSGDGVNTPLSVVSSGGGSASESIEDTDGDTKISTESAPDSDDIMVTTGGHDKLRIYNKGIEFLNNSTVSIGENSGMSHLDTEDNMNVNIGYSTGENITNGKRNVNIGYEAGKEHNSFDNVLIGYGAASAIDGPGSDNISIGSNTLQRLTSGNSNVCIGNESGRGPGSGNDNVYIGAGAGGSTSGVANARSGNVFIGRNAGHFETGSDKLYISNTITSTPLIKGDFATNDLTINGDVEVTGFLGTDEYSLPTTPGFTGQVITKSGNLSYWSFTPVTELFQNTPSLGPSEDYTNHSLLVGSRDDLNSLTEDTLFHLNTSNGSYFGGVVEDGVYASGAGSFRHGYNAQASGEAGVSIGYKCRANDDHAVAIGDSSIVTNEGGVAIGVRNKTVGLRGVAIGYNNNSNRENSITLGTNNTAKATGASLMGIGLENNTQNSTSLGRYNDPIQNTANSTVGPILTVGNGSDAANRSNAMVIDVNSNTSLSGNLAIGSSTGSGIFKLGDAKLEYAGGDYVSIDQAFYTTGTQNDLGLAALPWGDFYIDGTINFGSNKTFYHTSGEFRINDDLVPEDNEFVTLGKNNLQDAWDNIYSQNAVSIVSDRRLKKNIQNIEQGMKLVRKLRPIKYNLINRGDSEKQQLGFIAQEVAEIIPEVVNFPGEDSEFYSVTYSELVPVLVKAIQEQQSTIESLNDQINSQNAQLINNTEQLSKITALLESINLENDREYRK